MRHIHAARLTPGLRLRSSSPDRFRQTGTSPGQFLASSGAGIELGGSLQVIRSGDLFQQMAGSFHGAKPAGTCFSAFIASRRVKCARAKPGEMR